MHCEIVCLKNLEERYPNEDLRAKVISQVVAYVTLEPCIMCGYALNIAGTLYKALIRRSKKGDFWSRK